MEDNPFTDLTMMYVHMLPGNIQITLDQARTAITIAPNGEL